MNDILTYTVYPNVFPNGYSDVVPLFRIFSSMLTFSTFLLQKAKVLGKYHKQAEGIIINNGKLLLKIVYFRYEYQFLLQ